MFSLSLLGWCRPELTVNNGWGQLTGEHSGGPDAFWGRGCGLGAGLHPGLLQSSLTRARVGVSEGNQTGGLADLRMVLHEAQGESSSRQDGAAGP
jgi:hypothetical protein